LQPLSGDHQATQIGTTIGTAAFMSPEQAAGHIDRQAPPSDIYSLGATLYALLTGRPPFADADIPEVIRQVQSGGFPPPRQVKQGTPLPLDAVCCKAMALRPEDRYATALELGAEVERWLADEPVCAWREPWRVRWGRRARRRPVIALWVVASAVAYSSVLVSALMLPLIKAQRWEPALLLGIFLLFFFAAGMSVAAQGGALLGALVALALGRLTAPSEERRTAGRRWASSGAKVGLVVGAALGYLGVVAYFLQTPGPGFRARWLIGTFLLGPLLGAGLGLLIGARKSARARGGVLGSLAGAALVIIVGRPCSWL
jgi:hypothetical protein